MKTTESGTVMVLVMLITAMIAGLGIAYVATTTAQNTMVTEAIDNTGYEKTALAGFEVARAYLLSKYTTNTVGWDTELTTSTSTAYMANYNYTGNIYHSNYTPLSANTTNYTSWPFQWNRNFDYNGNTFRAKLEDNNDLDGNTSNDADGVVKLTIEAWGPGNDANMRQQPIVLEAMISYKKEPYAPVSALVVGGSLEVTGNPTITGTLGSVQSNGAVTITGSSYINGDVTCVGDISAPPGSIHGSSNSFSDETRIPPISPAQYSYLATHIFKTNGSVYDQNNNLLTTPTGWSYNSGTQTWSKGGAGGNTVNNGVFYFQGSNVDMGGSAGSASNPMTLTIMATGYINVTGSPSLMPHPNGGGIALMAGTDLRMRGAGGNIYGTGLYAAHEQVSLTGTPQIVGTVLAEDAADNCSLVSSVNNIDLFGTITELAGNTLLTYNGNLTTVLIDGYPYMKVLGFKKRIKPRS